MGLGLSIVERLGRILDHPIGLASNIGHGSTFSITVPRAETRPRVIGDAVPSPPPGSLAGWFVLCIDNEPAVLRGMETLLTGWGCRVCAAESSARALEEVAAAGEPPDVILADYHIDVGTGIDAILALRQKLGLDIPAVIITADHTLEVEREVRRHGFAMLRKPLKAAALRAILAQYMVRRSAAAE